MMQAKRNTMTKESEAMETFWTTVWQILREECGAASDGMGFVNSLGDFREWRFQGALGLGGKVWHVNDNLYVNCYPEDRNAERDAMIERANFRLAKLVERKGE